MSLPSLVGICDKVRLQWQAQWPLSRSSIYQLWNHNPSPVERKTCTHDDRRITEIIGSICRGSKCNAYHIKLNRKSCFVTVTGLTCSMTSGAIQHGVPTNVLRTLFRVMSPPVARKALTPKSEKWDEHKYNPSSEQVNNVPVNLNIPQQTLPARETFETLKQGELSHCKCGCSKGEGKHPLIHT